MQSSSESQRAPPIHCTGTLAKLCPGYAAWRVAGRAGRQNGDDEADLMLFAAARGVVSADLLASFFAFELGALDWLADYLRNDQLEQLVATLRLPDEEDEEEEELLYDRRALNAPDADYAYEP